MQALAARYALPPEYDSDASTDSCMSSNRQGLGLCHQIFEHAAEDRKRSAKALKNHKGHAVAPGTRDNNARWLNYFDAVRATSGIG